MGGGADTFASSVRRHLESSSTYVQARFEAISGHSQVVMQHTCLEPQLHESCTETPSNTLKSYKICLLLGPLCCVSTDGECCGSYGRHRQLLLRARRGAGGLRLQLRAAEGLREVLRQLHAEGERESPIRLLPGDVWALQVRPLTLNLKLYPKPSNVTLIQHM